MSPYSLVRRLTLGLIAAAALMTMPVPASGLGRRGYAAHLPMPTTAAWTAPTSARPGIGVYLDTGCPAPPAPGALPELERLPLSRARTEILWSGVEPARGSYQWERWDRVVNSLNQRDHRVLGVLYYWVSRVDPYSDEAIEAFGKYAESVARKYRGRVPAWEVWNEPNEKSFRQPTPERYVRLLQAAYEGVKRGYALFRTDWQPRPTRAALDRVVRQLQSTTPCGSGLPSDHHQPRAAGSPHVHAGLQSWCFRRGSEDQRASWSPESMVVVATSSQWSLGRTVIWEPLSEEPR